MEPIELFEIELEPKDGGTEVKWLQTFDTAEHYGRLAQFVAAANAQNLERLAVEVSGRNGHVQSA